MKSLFFIFILIYSFNVSSKHDVCIAIYPTPPECLHDEKKDNDNKLLTGAVLLVSGYYLFKVNDNEQKAFDVSKGINLYRRGNFEINTFDINYDFISPKRFKTNGVQVNFLSLIYQLH
tara:strand:+ start:136 stop:489 length:354 start_codon:yes stop_codon:yes gene_type:complete